MPTEATLGIDTSCYTTSLALARGGRIIASERRLLSVPQGERGLRQSDAVFQHVRALPELLETLKTKIEDYNISAVSVSAKPRDALDSYMPVFQTGKSFAEVIALTCHVPLYYTTHQQGHIRAALYESGMPKGSFIALHLSGGTTQSVLVDEKLNTVDIGGTNDLNAGQLVDRIGVRLGLEFPAGPQLEALAENGTANALIPLSRRGLECSFSGAENGIIRLLEKGVSKQDAAREVYSFLERSIFHLIAAATDSHKINRVLLAGGVASSRLLRQLLEDRVSKRLRGVRLYWAKPELSSDNACGVALIGEDKRLEREYGADH